MNKEIIQKKLIEERLNPRSCSLEDEEKDEALCLRQEGGGWCVYYSERGLKTGEKCFARESSACECFLGEMRSDPATKIGWKSGFSM